MNKTHLEHLIITLVLQLVLWPLLGIWGAGAFAIGIFLGREISQHETSGGGANAVNWHYGITHHWTLDSILDVAVPLAAALALATLLTLLGASGGLL